MLKKKVCITEFPHLFTCSPTLDGSMEINVQVSRLSFHNLIGKGRNQLFAPGMHFKTGKRVQVRA